MKKTFLFLSILALTTLVVGCNSPLSDMKQMKQSTQNMEASTGKLQAGTDQMKDTMRLMQRDVGDTYQDLRKGNSLVARNDLIRAMEQDPTIEGKIEDAGKYFMAFEFQFWKSRDNDSVQRRNTLLFEGAEEFSYRMRSYLPGDRKLDVASKNQSMMNLFALAIALDKILPEQEELAETLKFEKMSIRSIIVEALESKAKIDSGDLQKPKRYLSALLNSENEYVYLLQVRYNFIYAEVLEIMSHVGNAGTIKQFWFYMNGMDVDLSSLNVSQLNLLNELLEKANADRALLAKLGYATPFDKTMANFYGKLRLEVTSPQGKEAILSHLKELKTDSQTPSLKLKLLKKLVQQLTEVVR